MILFYDFKDLLSEGYRAPEITVQYTCDLIPESERATTRVLDIGAGTGLVAKGVSELINIFN